MAGMFSAMFSGFLWLITATLFSLPVSTTHSIVGAVIGFAVVSQGWTSVVWSSVAKIAASWVISPCLGGTISFLLFKITTGLCFKTDNPITQTIKMMPIFFGVSLFIFALFFVSKGLSNVISLTLLESFLTAIVVGLLSYIVHVIFFRPRMRTEIPEDMLDKHRSLLSIDILRPNTSIDMNAIKTAPPSDSPQEEADVILEVEGDKEEVVDQGEVVVSNRSSTGTGLNETEKEEENKDEPVEVLDEELQKTLYKKLQTKSADKLFAPLMVLSCMFLATAHGSNDIANSIGPYAAILTTFRTHSVDGEAEVPPAALALGAVSLTIGLAVLGHKVIQTIGKKLTKITALNGSVIQISAAATVLVGSALGLPISTSHILIGAVIGQALARKTSVNWKMVRGIIYSWLLTLPVASLTSALIYHLLTFGL
ncbi:hypothetical protein GEMRC1_003950 [Eukaryota sp. GEM-RC1]